MQHDTVRVGVGDWEADIDEANTKCTSRDIYQQPELTRNETGDDQ